MSARLTFLAAGALLLAGAAVYANSLNGAFVFDDIPAISENPTIRHLGHIREILTPPGEQAGTVGGRPLVNLSLALNYALGGTAVRGYHELNLLIHLLAALTLYGIIRRTVASLPKERPASRASALALAVALLWAVHPLQTESVTYVIQRAESLMGLCYLLTLYCAIRHMETPSSAAVATVRGRDMWAVLSVFACLLGMAAKEVMVSAPLLVLLYDRTFAAGSFGEAWRRRRGLYAGLAATWLLLAILMAGTGGRGGSVGFATEMGAGRYALVQCSAIGRYLQLAVWPRPLVFDYGTNLVESPGTAVWSFLLLASLVAVTAWGLARKPIFGFLGGWFFGILAPTSSFIPIATEPIAEHRMYLPLAALALLAVIGLDVGFGGIGKKIGRTANRRGRTEYLVLLVCGALALGLGLMTIQRNRDYRSALSLWTDTAQKMPGNPRAHNDLGSALLAEGRIPAAMAEFTAALQIQPGYAPAHYNLGGVLLDAGRPREAVQHFEKALAGPLHVAEAQLYLAEALSGSSRMSEAMVHYQTAARLNPSSLPATFGLGNALAAQGRYDEAIPVLQRAVKLAPDEWVVRNNLANALLYAGRADAAIVEYQEALRLRPNNSQLRENLAQALRFRGTGPIRNGP